MIGYWLLILSLVGLMICGLIAATMIIFVVLRGAGSRHRRPRP